jgi:hypothetical protein
MDSFVGALLAAAVGWTSIVLASVAPVSRDRLPALRLAGGASLGLVALVVVDVPVPSWLGLLVIAIGLAVALRPRRWMRAPAQDGATQPNVALPPKDP